MSEGNNNSYQIFVNPASVLETANKKQHWRRIIEISINRNQVVNTLPPMLLTTELLVTTLLYLPRVQVGPRVSGRASVGITIPPQARTTGWLPSNKGETHGTATHHPSSSR